ncbi:MAG: caspase family protein, partial [Pseudorhodoplanes sp.]
KRMVRDFTSVARDADVAVLYFAGHGIEVNGVNYLVPVDAKLATDFDVEDEALSLDRLLRALEPVKRLRLVILDACRDNPFVRNMQRGVVSRVAPAPGLAKVEPVQSDTLVAFAARANSTADDGVGPNSPFTAALLSHLAVPGRDVRIALGFVRDEVLKTTRNKQEPFVYGSLGGATVALVPEVKQAEPKREIAVQPATVPLPSAGVDPRRDYEFAERVGTREAWESFLTLHPSGFYADLARAQRDKLAAKVEIKAAPAPEVPPVALIAPNPPAEKKPANISVLPPPGAGKPVEAPAAIPPAAIPPAERKAPNVAVLPPPSAPRAPDLEPNPEPKVNVAALTRDLQTELRRVGCGAGRADGSWSARWRDVMSDFNKRAGTEFDIKVASTDALDGVKSQRGRICPLICGRNQHVEGDDCVANPVEKKPSRREASRPPDPSPRERARERERERAKQERGRERREVSRPARSSCPAGSSPFSQGGRQCCEITPERGASRIFCP